MHRCHLWLIVAACLSGATSAQAVDQIYWADASPNQISRADIDGSDRITLDSLSYVPIALRLDKDSGTMFWNRLGQNGVQRANLDGSNVQTILNFAPDDMDIDTVHDQLWFSTSTSTATTYYRSNLNGSNFQTLFTTSVGHSAFDLDPINGKIYYISSATGNFPGKHLGRMNLDGTNRQVLVSEDNLYSGVALDIAAGKMYWAIGKNSEEVHINRANLDGTGLQTIVPASYFAGRNALPFSLEVDPIDQKLYWVDGIFQNDQIMRSNLDGTNVQLALDPQTSGVINIQLQTFATVPEPSSIVTAIVGMAAFVGIAFRRKRNRRPHVDLALPS